MLVELANYQPQRCKMSWPFSFSHNFPSDPSITNTTTAVSGTVSVNMTPAVKWNVKLCRECQHAHFEGNEGFCGITFNESVTFIACKCPEYVPTDNLDYLEWKYKKNDSKKLL